MAKYRKLIVAVVGLLILLGQEFLNLDLSAHADALVEVAIAVGTALGVYAVPNEPA